MKRLVLMGPLASKLFYLCMCKDDLRIEQRCCKNVKECVTDDRQCRQATKNKATLMDDVKCRHKDADKWRQNVIMNCVKDDKKVAKKDDKKSPKRTTIVLPNICLFK